MVRFQSDMQSSCAAQASPAQAVHGGQPTSSSGRPFSEQGGTQADFGGTLLHGDLEIVAHPHRAHGQSEFVDESANCSEAGSCRLGRLPGRPDRHQPQYVEFGLTCTVDQLRRVVERTPPLPGSPVVSTCTNTRAPGDVGRPRRSTMRDRDCTTRRRGRRVDGPCCVAADRRSGPRVGAARRRRAWRSVPGRSSHRSRRIRRPPLRRWPTTRSPW
jgi:hypothetical protein